MNNYSKQNYNSKYFSKKNSLNIYVILLSVFLIFVLLLIILNPQKYINSCYNGLLIWAKNVLPSLLPFLIITKILTELNIYSLVLNKISFIPRVLFNAPAVSSYPFLMSIISGYPVGAKTICDLYLNGQISSKTATKLTTFCSTSGPIFVIGTVGSIMFNNVAFGYIVYLSHILSSILNGIIFRNCFVDVDKNKKKLNKNIKNQTNYSNILSSSMTNSILSILTVGGFISLSYILIDILFEIKLLDLFSCFINNILGNNLGNILSSGIIEVTRGCFELSNGVLNMKTACIVASGLITFGGVSIHLQSLSFLSQAKVNVKFYFLQKLVHTILACILAIIFGSIFL